jgi:hypothetical protein
MKTFYSLLLTMAMVGGIGCGKPAPNPTSNPSALDGISNSAGSWHSAHVNAVDCCGAFVLDDGTRIKLCWTGGSNPHFRGGEHGIIYASVPSYLDNDSDNAYYFQKLVPDRLDTLVGK